MSTSTSLKNFARFSGSSALSCTGSQIALQMSSFTRREFFVACSSDISPILMVFGLANLARSYAAAVPRMPAPRIAKVLLIGRCSNMDGGAARPRKCPLYLPTSAGAGTWQERAEYGGFDD